MANNKLAVSTGVPDRTLYALIWYLDATIYNGATSEAYVTGDRGDYDVPLTEEGTASGVYTATFPSIAAGEYRVEVYDQTGASPAEPPTDTLVWTDEHVAWDGAAFVTLYSRLAPATAGRSLVVDAAGLADANVVKLGPTGSGTAQTARDLGLALPAVAPGAANGLLIAGSNAATTFATLTVSGAVAFGSTFAVTGTTTLNALTVTNALTVSGTTSLAAVSTSGTVTLNALTVTNATTLSGAVSLGSTLGVTGTVTFNAFTVTNALTVSGATTLTGAVTASNASNNIVGIDVAKWGGTAVATAVVRSNVIQWAGDVVLTPIASGLPRVDVWYWTGGSAASLVGGRVPCDVGSISSDSTAADNAEAFFDGTGYGVILQRTTIATLSSQTSFTLTAGSADNDAYNLCEIVVQDASTAAQKAVGVVLDYTGASKTVTLLTDPAVFTMAASDIVTILASRSLKPTVDNRTLDVTATGAAGIDWANVENSTTTLNLSGTTIKTATDVEADTADIQARLPAALTGDGNIKADVLAISGDGTAADSLEAALDGTGGVTFSANLSGSVGSIAAAGITSGSFATGAINAAAIAAGAIGASELAADAVAEIAGAVWDETTAGHTTGGTFGEQLKTDVDAILADTNELQVDWVNGGRLDLILDARASQTSVDTIDGIVDAILEDTGTTLQGEVDGIQADTEDIQARLPAALVSGRIDASVGAMAANTLTASALAADAVAEIQSGLSTLTAADIQTALVTGGLVLNSTTIATLASQTSFTLTAGSADNDAYNGCVVVVTDASTAVQKAVGVILDYTGATKTVTLLTDPAVFTMAAGDAVDVLPCRALKPTVDTRTLDVTATGTAGLDWANVEGATTTVGLSGTTVKTATDVETDTVDIQSRLGTPSNLGSGATVAANLVDIEGQTDDIGAAGAGLTAIPWNAAWDAEVQSECADALVAYDAATGTDVSAVETDTADIQSRLPAALGANGNIKADVRDFNGTAGTFSSGRPEVNATHWGGTAVASANVRANLTQILGTAPTEGGAGRLAGAFTTLLDVAAPVFTVASVNQTGDSYARLGAPAGASVSADIAAIEAQTDDIGAAGAGLTAVPWNAAWDAEVQSEVQDAIEVNNLDHLLKIAVDTDWATTVHLNSVIGHLADNGTTATFDRTTDSQEAIRDRGDAAWTTATGFSTHSAADVWAVGTRVLTAGTNIQLPSNGLANVTTWTVAITGNVTGNLSGSVGSVTGSVGSVTGNVGGNVGGNVVGSVGSISGITFPTNFGALGINVSGHVSRVVLTDTLTTYTGNTPQTGDSFARIGATGSGLTSLAPSATALSTVQWTNTRAGLLDNLDTTVSSRSTITAAQVNSEVDTALIDVRLDELLAADSDIDGVAPPTVGSVFHELMSKTTGSFTFDQTTDSLEALRDRGDAAWTTATGFSTHGAADVWAVAARTLTSAANLTNTGGTITVSSGSVSVYDFTTAAKALLEVEATDALNAYDPPTKAELDAAVSTLALQATLSAVKTKTDQITFTTANKVDATLQAAADLAQGAADKVWATAARTLTAFAFSVTVGTNNDKTGYALTQAFPTNFPSLAIDANGRVKIQSGVTAGTALSDFGFVMLSNADHVTPATGLTVTAERSINGGAFAACTNSPSEVGSGDYQLDLSASDMNGTVIVLKLTATGADTVFVTFITTA